MKKIFLTAVLLLSVILIKAQTKAVTETGDEVILYEDKSWAYVNDTIEKQKEIKLNDKNFLKSKSSTFLVQSKKVNVGIWINPKKWSFSKGSKDEVSEFKFQLIGGDLYGMLISEKLEISIEALQDIAIENAKSAAQDLKITHEEYRNVNGVKVLMMQMSGTIQGIKFVYYGYYFSNSKGAIQLLTYTSKNLFKDNLPEIEEFLNGFVEL